jgi:hypothetical protein
LFYNSEEQYLKYSKKQGIGRCFAFNHDKGLVIFNAYGIPLSTIAQGIAKAVEAEYSKISIFSHNAYINKGNMNNEGHDGGSEGLGYLVGHNLNGISSVDIGDITLDENCEKCDKLLSSRNSKKIDGKYWCDKCIMKTPVFKCKKCGEYTAKEHRVDSFTICQPCYEGLPTCCNHGKTLQTSYRVWHSNKTVCQKCVNEGLASSCDGCGRMVIKFLSVGLPKRKLHLCIACVQKTQWEQ